ncbi:conserved hypothetical protein [Theileria orientalis strain Shintoku]|uniref:Uncharacterized protein n=1 Tax=Theileria orientalis strain Shintoku TaxID=869250 RepID=J4C3E9_THEOR|nr:conserved hypothetical protein [Theileria orientalis strain Shintoku]BAM40321.1 conserved hypothetical protein [Theileria orientalis strain Shintoku]|eukprot:XP_009690622.1 conserved hypothetical protein [Theileria orientalis strain Shintoku]
MLSGTTVIADFLEPFILGISCIVGGEQFSILLSHTTLSLKVQSFILIAVSLVTIVVSAFIEAEYSFFNGFHCYHGILSIFLYVMVNNRFKSFFYVTAMTFCIGFVVTFLIVQSLAHYLTSRMQLLAFVYGIFISRSLPYMCWYFVNKKIPYESQLHSVATSLGSMRIIFCFFSMSIKIFLGRFKFTSGSEISSFDRMMPQLTVGINYFLTDKDLLWIPSVKYVGDKDKWSNLSFPTFLTYCFFMVSVIVYSAFPSLIHSIYSIYSTNIISLLTMIRAISHLFGSCFGISFPATISGNLSFLVITCLSYVIVIVNMYFYYKFYNMPILFFFELLTGFCLGYLWSYTLGTIVSTSLNRNCRHQDHKIDCCCGDKINNQCFCRLPFIIEELKQEAQNEGASMLRFFILKPTEQPEKKGQFPCSRAANNKGEQLRYHKESKNAVLIFVGPEVASQVGKVSERCAGANTECLRLIRAFSLESVTTSSCTRCQLTVRLEAKEIKDALPCKGCSEGSQCNCFSEPGKCCCIAFKSCSTQCKKANCKVHFCCCNDKCAACKDHIKSDKSDTARLFLCFKNDNGACTLKEIKPNDSTDFDGDFSKTNEFDITCMFFSDCCHVDLQVDLYCTMKNNFFRLTGINFPKKYTKPSYLFFSPSTAKCVHKRDPQCCCAHRDLVRLAVKYDPLRYDETCSIIYTSRTSTGGSSAASSSEQSVQSSSGASSGHTSGSTSGVSPQPTQGSSTGKCPEICALEVDTMDSFYKKIYPHRAKLVVLCLSIFSLLFFLTFLVISVIRASKRHYVFKPRVRLTSLVGIFSSNEYNSNSQIITRLNSLSEVAKLEDNIYRQKTKEYDQMMLAFRRQLGEDLAVRLLTKIENLSDTFLSNNGKPEYKRLDKGVIKWSHAVGFMYKYVIMHFFSIQKYFAVWEKNWAVEYRNYRRSIGLSIDQMSLKSKFSLTLMNDPKLSETKFNSIGISRLVTWNKVLKEVQLYSTLIEKEVHLSLETLPMKLGTRLEHFVERWDHRVENIVHWSKRMTNIYDWSNFLAQYARIKEWVHDVSPYLKGNSDVRFQLKDLNKGTEVFSQYRID